MTQRAQGPPQYVYGFVRPCGVDHLDTAGVGDVPVRMLSVGDVGAVVSDAPGDVTEATRAMMLAHARVLDAALAVTTVLPLRFGVVLPDEAALIADVIEPRATLLDRLLEEMHGRVEVNVKAYYDEETVLAEIIERDPTVRRLRLRGRAGAPLAERIRLGEAVAHALEGTRQRDEDALVSRLQPLAVSAERTPPAVERMVCNASFLVERDAVAAFDRAVDELGRQASGRMTLKYVGPLPPYSFVDAELGVGS